MENNGSNHCYYYVTARSIPLYALGFDIIRQCFFGHRGGINHCVFHSLYKRDLSCPKK